MSPKKRIDRTVDQVLMNLGSLGKANVPWYRFSIAKDGKIVIDGFLKNLTGLKDLPIN